MISYLVHFKNNSSTRGRFPGMDVESDFWKQRSNIGRVAVATYPGMSQAKINAFHCRETAFCQRK